MFKHIYEQLVQHNLKLKINLSKSREIQHGLRSTCIGVKSKRPYALAFDRMTSDNRDVHEQKKLSQST